MNLNKFSFKLNIEKLKLNTIVFIMLPSDLASFCLTLINFQH